MTNEEKEPNYKSLYEQEHKKYGDAVERMKSWMNGEHPECFSEAQKAAEFVFPELKESEDEKIRKEIISFLKEGKPYYCPDSVKRQGWAAWLEKQGEQKHTNKVEPKFKAGDWVIYVCGEYSATLQIKNIVDGTYEFTDDSTLNVVDENTLRLWTIQDAKDGDVLASDNGCPFVYKKSDGTGARLYCCVSIANNFCIDDGIIHCGSKNSAKPATKEQCDLLFTKMKDDGYEWDAEKKELKKIGQETELPNGEDYGIDSLYHAARILEKTLGEVEGYQSDDGILAHKCAIEAVKRLYEHKSAWGEEDEKHLSLKDRMVWKPTEEQLSLLQAAIEECGYNQVLESLYNDLKKL